MNTKIIPVILVLVSCVICFAQGNSTTTIIHGVSSADGKSDVSERILEECLQSLPRSGDLSPVVSSRAAFLKEINGDPSRNEQVQTFSASLDINYMLYQKVLVIVATSSVQGQEPVMKVMEKNLRQSKHFEANSSNGDIFAGRSHRQYYFSSEDAARNDVIRQATAWLRQQASVACSK